MYPHRLLYWELIQGKKINQVKFKRNLFNVESLDKRFTMALADIGLLYPVQHERGNQLAVEQGINGRCL